MTSLDDNRRRGAAKNALIIVLVLAVVAAVACLKHVSRTEAPASRPATTGQPRFVELGAGQCEACKKMAVVVGELRQEYAGRVEILSVDVMEEAELAKTYGWRVIPTQIVYDAAGKETFRHEGFLPKEEIAAQLRAAGVR